MFTGIIEELGTIKRVSRSQEAMTLTIEAETILQDVALGDSIAINGICLTVTSFSKTQFTVDVMPETFAATTIGQLKAGNRVNLERAMAANGRFGGHFVTGHCDAVGTITSILANQNAIQMTIQFPENFRPYVIQKGSITVDGVSLTIFGLSQRELMISIIPHTVDKTILHSKKVGDSVNLEFDVLGKYILGAAEAKKSPQSKVTHDFLQKNGYA
ncbi:riboflavin synthase [Chryseomicrobium excrementi]|uniref:Riboflavin synthase n=1 Tax=Chryseomicrobium excrementi TaxID=2041346 RepID=A0A2M9EXP8_9BACL|nr:riboflavin synthase [Chryseomicrobium excrementi]PJK15993.1 riboflavin synthase [Chryseomicrobium excrementi]